MAEQKNKGGRPKKVIDYKIVESLAGVFCTQQEIATILNVGLRTLQNDDEFMRIYKEGHENAKSSLRRFQYKSAQNGNVTMQIWLGKQYLGQTDKQQTEHSFQEVRIVNDAPSQDK
jgi:hypothetical protein